MTEFISEQILKINIQIRANHEFVIFNLTKRLGTHRAFTFYFPPAQSEHRASFTPTSQLLTDGVKLPQLPAPVCLNSVKGRTGRVYKNHLNCHCEETARSTRQSMLRREGYDQRKLVGDCACAIFMLHIRYEIQKADKLYLLLLVSFGIYDQIPKKDFYARRVELL